MATIALPSTDFTDVKVVLERSQGATVCPYSLKTLVQSFGGRRYSVEIQVPPLKAAQAQAWSKFFHDMNGQINTFDLNIAPHVPHLFNPTVRPFRLAGPATSTSHMQPFIFGFSLQAVEVV